mmetsp:Transcript_2531/g.9779  ORF Transcript_2531/g.9779 Transcript_2531/m.9779 type:complete len:298 (+) Transcript_2531:471-1364(+)
MSNDGVPYTTAPPLASLVATACRSSSRFRASLRSSLYAPATVLSSSSRANAPGSYTLNVSKSSATRAKGMSCVAPSSSTGIAIGMISVSSSLSLSLSLSCRADVSACFSKSETTTPTTSSPKTSSTTEPTSFPTKCFPKFSARTSSSVSSKRTCSASRSAFCVSVTSASSASCVSASCRRVASARSRVFSSRSRTCHGNVSCALISSILHSGTFSSCISLASRAAEWDMNRYGSAVGAVSPFTFRASASAIDEDTISSNFRWLRSRANRSSSMMACRSTLSKSIPPVLNATASRLSL